MNVSLPQNQLVVMTTEEVAQKLVNLCRNQQHEKAINELYSDDIISIEPPGHTLEKLIGKEAVIGKSQHFYESVDEIHSQEISDPVIAGDYFSCSMKTDVTFGMNVGRMQLEEICLYQVKDGKIVKEQFFYELAK